MNRFTSATRGLLILVFTLLVACNLVFAQSEQGSLSGTVTDPTGAAIVNAKITVINQATSQTRTAASSGSGQYTVTA